MSTFDWKVGKEYREIRYELCDGVAKISINRPERRNAFTPLTVMEMYDAFSEARDDASVGVILLTGVNHGGAHEDEAFCSGGDQKKRGNGGYVGEGMLDAAVAGAVFTSPTPDQVYEGIKAVATDAGVLMVIKNYTGDVMNFEMAADMARDEGIKVAQVVVNDDVAVKDSLYTVGRRGVAGTVFVHKIAGAMAETGADLDAVQAVAQKVVDNVRTRGAAIEACIVPAAGKPGFELGEASLETFGTKGSAAVAAFNSILPGTLGGTIIQLSLVFFALSTILSWSYYGERCWGYLSRDNKVITSVYKVIFVLFCIVGATGSGDLMWNISDTLNGAMAIPNLIALLLLSGAVASITKEYFSDKK